jgi:hypothetical protein
MFNSQFRLIDSIRCAIRTAKARDALASRRFLEAHELLENAFQAIGLNMPSERAPFDMNLLAAFIYIEVESGPNALEAAELSLRQIESSKQLSEVDRRYLSMYCQSIIRFCLSWKNGVGNPKYDYEFGDINKLSRYLREKYPLPE